jgi:uncharacterized membrane protein
MTGWTRALLIGSLALNLAVAGIVAGAFLRARVWDHPPPRAAMLDPAFGPWGPALSREDRAALRAAFAAERGRVAAGLEAERADRAELLAVLRAEPFDPAALDAVSARLAARIRERVEIGQRLLRDRIVAMTPDERRAFADRLEAALSGRGKRPPGGGPGG